MDIQMPEMGGIEASKCIRKNNLLTPIIALTANNLDSLRQNCLDAGMNYFISKPLVVNEVDEIIRKTNELKFSQSSNN